MKKPNSISAQDYEVREVSREECRPFIEEIHYAKRWPSVSYRFGLFLGDALEGCITFGTPLSAPLRSGVAGADFARDVIELNRLVLRHNRPNEAGFLVSKGLKLLPSRKIVISFADSEQNHIGTVYQATNFTYHGLSAKRTDMRVRGLEHLHGISIADKVRHIKGVSRVEALRQKYGDRIYMTVRPRKHRYIFLVGDRKWKKFVQKAIRYPQEKYPKAV